MHNYEAVHYWRSVYLWIDYHSLLLTNDAYFIISLTVLSAIPQEVVSVTISTILQCNAYSIMITVIILLLLSVYNNCLQILLIYAQFSVVLVNYNYN